MMVTMLGVVLIFHLVFAGSLCSDEVNSRSQYPNDIIFGVSSSAYQVEGAWNLSGKGESIWDKWTHKNPGAIVDHSNGDVACDGYHKYRDDIQLISDTGFQMYKFSISWSRVLPEGAGTLHHDNPTGILYYLNLIDELVKNGIKPMVVLYHWDLPQELQAHGGWLNSSIVTHFENYSRMMFRLLGNKVKWWLTIEDPAAVAKGYGTSEVPPGLGGLHGFGEYRAAHNLLRAHAAAARIYRTEFAKEQRGKISFSLKADFIYPKSDSSEDIRAQDTAMQFTVGWFGHPVYSWAGDYPPVMRDYVDRNSALEGLKQSRLPYFTNKELHAIRGSSDFLAFSHMTSKVAKFAKEGPKPSWRRDSNVNLYFDPHWNLTDCDDIRVVPGVLQNIISWFADQYRPIPVFIVENGFCDRKGNNDVGRVDYYKAYLKDLYDTKRNGSNIIGYCTKSLLDSFEWNNGFRDKYGLFQVDFKEFLLRHEKKSAIFWKDYLKYPY